MRENWYETFFQGVTSEFWDKMVTQEFNEKEGRFLLSLLNLPVEAWVLDAPSGSGRMALWMASQKGICAEGWDINQESIELLNEEARRLKVPAIGVQANLVEVTPGMEKFDGAVCLGNCFGYFDHVGMERFIHHISYSLKKGASWVIHTGMLAESIFPNWMNEDIFEVGDMTMEIENTYDPLECKMEIKSTFTKPDGTREGRDFQHYIYTLKEVIHMLGKGGLELTGLYNGVEGEDFALGDEQLYIVARKL